MCILCVYLVCVLRVYYVCTMCVLCVYLVCIHMAWLRSGSLYVAVWLARSCMSIVLFVHRIHAML